jgi:dipeptidyl aminopeptidase/acylaminoacyl peptidase
MSFSLPRKGSGAAFLAAAWACLLLSLGACDKVEAPPDHAAHNPAEADNPAEPAPEETPQPPEAVTLDAGDVFANTVTLHGSVDPHGTTVETWFEWDLTAASLEWGPLVADSFQYQTAIRTVSDTVQTVSATIGSLEPATTYYFRAAARNAGATRYGAILSFATAPQPPAPPPSDGDLAFVRAGNIYLASFTEGGTEVAQLTTAGTFTYPTWSPDARRIAFASTGTDPKIYVINADGSGLYLFGQGTSPAWSPDGRQLAFSAHDNGNWAVFVASLDHPEQPAVRLGFERGVNDFPAWSPDGSRIAFTSDWEAFDIANEVYIENADGSGTTQVTNGLWGSRTLPTYTIYSQPSWSPDGLRFAVVACEEWQYASCARSTVGVMEADGSGFRVLANTVGYARPTWAPSGSTLLYTSGPDLFQVALDGSGKRLVIADAHSGVWRP